VINALWLGSAAMTAQQLKVDAIANNLANVNTTGYKRSRVSFQELIYVPEGPVASQTAPQPASQTASPNAPTGAAGEAGPAGPAPYGPVAVLAGVGVRPAGVERLATQGILQPTGIETDLGLDGEGYFGVTTAGGETLYTRDGHLIFDGVGNLVTANGDRVIVEGSAPLPAGARNISIDSDGTITATVEGEKTPRRLGRITLFRFVNPGGLEAVGQNLYRATGASGQAVQESSAGAGSGPAAPGAGAGGAATTRIRQGFLETSNVSVLDEMVGLIEAQRAYEISAKIIQNADNLLAIANGLRR